MHLSPISDVSKAYSQRLSQLRSELGLDQDDESEHPSDLRPEEEERSPVESPSAAENHEPEHGKQQAEPTENSFAEESAISDEALIDAVFREVLDGEASEGASLGAASSSQTIHVQEHSIERKHKLGKELSFDDWYDHPPVHTADESDVTDYVAELLHQSMDEAIFSASKSLKGKSRGKQKGLLLTETSVDKSSLIQIGTLEHSDEKGEPPTENGQAGGEDPILKAVFTSSINNQQLLESVISYPPSICSSLPSASAVTTPATAATREDSNVFFASQSSSGLVDEGDVTYVSSASVVMNDTHSSSEGDFDEDHIIKLVFSEAVDKLRGTPRHGVESTRKRASNMETMEETVEESSQTPNSSVDSEVGATESLHI